MAYTDYFDEVQSIYIAYYQRPADPAGLRYWAQRLNAEGGNLDAIIDAFSNSPEAKSLYTETDPLKLVDSVYQALFGRPADNGADNFYAFTSRRSRQANSPTAAPPRSGASPSTCSTGPRAMTASPSTTSSR